MRCLILVLISIGNPPTDNFFFRDPLFYFVKYLVLLQGFRWNFFSWKLLCKMSLHKKMISPVKLGSLWSNFFRYLFHLSGEIIKHVNFIVNDQFIVLKTEFGLGTTLSHQFLKFHEFLSLQKEILIKDINKFWF